MFTPRNGSHPKGNKSNPSLYIVHCIKNRPKSSPPVINPQSCGSIRWFRQSNDYHSRMIPTLDRQRNVPGARCTFRTVRSLAHARTVPTSCRIINLRAEDCERTEDSRSSVRSLAGPSRKRCHLLSSVYVCFCGAGPIGEG